MVAPWQAATIEQHAEEFLQGLIDTNGCRHRRIVKGRDYSACSSSNRSEDLLTLSERARDRIRLRWRRASHDTISSARRLDVSRRDAIMARTPVDYTTTVIPSSVRNTSTPGA